MSASGLSNKGQITVFIIIGILIVLVAGGVIVFTTQDVEQELKVQEEAIINLGITPIKQYTEACVQTALEDAILYVGQRGGYYEVPLLHTFFYSNVLQIPVYFVNESIAIPTAEDIEQEIALYVTDHLSDCNYSTFVEQGYDLAVGNLKADVSLTPATVKAQVILPLTIVRGNEEVTLSLFTGHVPTRLGEMHAKSTQALEERAATGLFCVSCLVEWAEQEDFMIQEYFNLQTGSTVMQFHDSQRMIDDQPVVFQFAWYEPPNEPEEGWWVW